jgi:hypothetical protein
LFDTIRLGAEDVTLDIGRLRKSGFVKMSSEKVDAEGVITESVLFRLLRADESPSFLQYYPTSGNVALETSLPKVWFGGQNVSMLSPEDISPALDELSNRVADLVGDVPHCGLWGIRGRCDPVFCWDTFWSGRRHTVDYLHAFRNVELPRHYCQAVDREATLYWRNGSRVIRLYDKEAETKLDIARGLLRFETQLKHSKKELGDVAGITSTKARDVLTWNTARSILQKYLDGLGGDLVVTDDERLFQFLREKVGNTKAIRLIGFVFASRLYSRDELERQGHSRKTLWRYSSEIKKSGASVGESKSGLLPPLVLPGDEYTGAAGVLA